MGSKMTPILNLYEKKGQLANSSVGAVIVLVIGIGVAVLVLIFVGALSGQTYNLVESDINEIGNTELATNVSVAMNNVTAQYLGHRAIHTDSLLLYNETGGIPLHLDNFTVNYDLGTILLNPGVASEFVGNGSTALAHYSYGNIAVQNSVKAGVVSAFGGLEQTGSYLPLIVLAVVIALVLTIVLGFTAFGMRGGGGSAL